MSILKSFNPLNPSSDKIFGAYSHVAGGCHNTVSGACSAILGGCGNTVTNNYAAVFGHGLSSVADDTFHVSCLNAKNTPPFGLYPIGTVMYRLGCALIPSDKVLVIV